MPTAKDIYVRLIPSQDAHAFVKRHHYSGKSLLMKSRLHFGVSLGDRLCGVLQFGEPMDRSKLAGLVSGCGWNDFIELNRMVMIDDTPRNTESRAISLALRLIHKQYPRIQWVVSFADATQCGDGTIYRAAGFVLTGIKRNTTLWEGPVEPRQDAPDYLRSAYMRYIRKHGRVFASITLQTGGSGGSGPTARFRSACWQYTEGAIGSNALLALGCERLNGFQLRYIYFLDRTARGRLTVPEIPFGKIAEVGAGMYKGRPKDSSEPPATHAGEGGAAPTRALQNLFPLRDRMARSVTG